MNLPRALSLFKRARTRQNHLNLYQNEAASRSAVVIAL